jgi:lactam utilization protein B
MAFITKRLQKKMDEILAQRQLDNEERMKYRKEAELTVAKEKAAANTIRFKKEEELKAREGGFLKRTAKSLVNIGIAELNEELKKKPRKRKDKRAQS